MPQESADSRPSFFIRYGGLIFGIILIAAVIGIARHVGEGQRFLTIISEINPLWLILAYAIEFATYFCNAGMWRATLRRSGTPVPMARLFTLSIAKLFIDQAAPSGGLAGSIMVTESLAGKNVPRATAVRALFIGLAGYYVAYVALFGSALVYLFIFASVNRFVFWTAIVFGLVVLVFALIIILFWAGLATKLPKWLTGHTKLGPFITALHEAPGHITSDWKMLLEAALSAAGIFLLDALSLYIILHALGIPLETGKVFASFMISSVAMTIGLVPGGLGVFEGASTAMLHFFGVSIEAALTATLILRGFTYWLPMIPGLLIARRELRRKE
jgi:uncharacterized protein (TIRG00374 family)